MNIFPIPGANMNLAETQDEYMTLPVRAEKITVVVSGDGEVDDVPCMRSAWRPSREELALLLDGGYIELCVLGTTHPPVMLNVAPDPETMPANTNANPG